MVYVLGAALALSIISNFFSIYFMTKSNQQEKKSLHDRLMSRDYPEYLQGMNIQEKIEAEAKKEKDKPKKEEILSPGLIKHKKKAEQF